MFWVCLSGLHRFPPPPIPQSSRPPHPHLAPLWGTKLSTQPLTKGHIYFLGGGGATTFLNGHFKINSFAQGNKICLTLRLHLF